jgi:hypothetical protein
MNFRLKSFIESTFPEDFYQNPETYLGPNWQTVMNFYTLFYNGKLRFIDPHNNVVLVGNKNSHYTELVREIVLDVIPSHIMRRLPYPLPVFELIAMHLLLDRGETLKFVPLFTTEDYKNGF